MVNLALESKALSNSGYLNQNSKSKKSCSLTEGGGHILLEIYKYITIGVTFIQDTGI